MPRSARRERQREGSTASSNTISSGPQQHGAISGDDNHAQTLHDPNDGLFLFCFCVPP